MNSIDTDSVLEAESVSAPCTYTYVQSPLHGQMGVAEWQFHSLSAFTTLKLAIVAFRVQHAHPESEGFFIKRQRSFDIGNIENGVLELHRPGAR